MNLSPFKTRDFNSQILRSAGKTYIGATCIGELAALVGRIEDGNVVSWHEEWRALADSLEARAGECVTQGETESARLLYLRACEAHRQATFFHRSDLDCEELQAGWPRIGQCLEQALSLAGYTVEALRIPFESAYLHAYLLAPAGATGPLPTLVMPSGYDSLIAEIVLISGVSALARGWAVFVFDGPGQGATLYDPGARLYMRPDFEKVLPVAIDAALEHSVVDPDRMVAVGCSFGGYLVPRGAAGEPRLAALVADPGQYDLGAGILSMLPASLQDRLDEEGDEARSAFEALATGVDGALLFGPRMAAHGIDSVQTYLRELMRFTNRDHAAMISCPCLICDNEVDVVSTGQGKKLAEAIQAPVEFLRFTAEEGAGGHCEGAGREIFDERVYRWLSRKL